MTPLPLQSPRQGQCNRHPLQANDGRCSLTQSNFAFICAPSTCRTSAVSCSSFHLLPKHFPRLLSNSPPRCICIVARSDARFHPSRQHSAAHPCEHSVVPHRNFLLSLRDHIQVQPLPLASLPPSPFPFHPPPPPTPLPLPITPLTYLPQFAPLKTRRKWQSALLGQTRSVFVRDTAPERAMASNALCMYIIGVLFLVNAVHDFVLRSADVPVCRIPHPFFHAFELTLCQILSLPNFYKTSCVVFFCAECVIMLLANALIFLDACADPSNLQK